VINHIYKRDQVWAWHDSTEGLSSYTIAWSSGGIRPYYCPHTAWGSWSGASIVDHSGLAESEPQPAQSAKGDLR